MSSDDAYQATLSFEERRLYSSVKNAATEGYSVGGENGAREATLKVVHVSEWNREIVERAINDAISLCKAKKENLEGKVEDKK